MEKKHRHRIHWHDKPPKAKLSLGQRSADMLTAIMGSWIFILLFILLLITWVFVNGYFLLGYSSGKPFDPFPFILLNLILSCLAAIQAPIILMSQNRQAEKDRRGMEYDYAVNRKAEHEIANMQSDLEIIKDLIRTVRQDYKLDVQTGKGVESVKRHVSDVKKDFEVASKDIKSLNRKMSVITNHLEGSIKKKSKPKKKK